MKPKTKTPPFLNTNSSKSKKFTLHSTPSLPSCFRPRAVTRALEHPHAPPMTTTSTTHYSNPNLTTSLYQTNLGLFSLTWSKSLLTRSLYIHIYPNNSFSPSTSPSLTSPILHLSLKPFLFWNKQGIRKLQLCLSNTIWVFWDLTQTKFGSGPEPESGFYIVVLSQGEVSLLVGDMVKEAYAKTKARNRGNPNPSSLVLKREHVVSKSKMYATRIDINGRSSLVSIELNDTFEENPRLVITLDGIILLQVSHLKWKFRGSQRAEAQNHSILISWDVYNWLFEPNEGNSSHHDDGYALFTLRFENDDQVVNDRVKKWCYSDDYSCGLNFERRMMKKKLLMKSSRSSSFSSSLSLSSVSSSCGSVLDWVSVEENEMNCPNGFSLLVYAWKN